MAGLSWTAFPGPSPQAEALDALLGEAETPPLAVANLELDEDELRRRIAGRRGEDQRSDDSEETMLNRFHVYQKQTAPLLDYYRDRVSAIDGRGTVDAVFERLTSLLTSTKERA